MFTLTQYSKNTEDTLDTYSTLSFNIIVRTSDEYERNDLQLIQEREEYNEDIQAPTYFSAEEFLEFWQEASTDFFITVR